MDVETIFDRQIWELLFVVLHIYLFIYKNHLRKISVGESPKGSANHNHHGTFLIWLQYLLDRRLLQKTQVLQIITWAIARRIGLSTYDVKNGAIGSSIICPFYLPKITGTTNSTSMRDVISLIYDRLQ